MIELINKFKIENLNDEDIKKFEAFKTILTLQNNFQIKALGTEDWYEVNYLNEKPVNYILAVFAELGELLASSDYEWWANKGTKDIENIKTELIDILHFDLSRSLKNLYLIFKNVNQNFNFEHYMLNILQKPDLEDYFLRVDSEKTQLLYETMTEYVHTISSPIFYFDPAAIYNYSRSIHLIFKMFEMIEVPFEEVIARYLVKNALNFVRKANGYKEGKYEKMWISLSGPIAEDNVIALEIVSEKQKKDNTILDIEEIIDLLNGHYRTIVLSSL